MKSNLQNKLKVWWLYLQESCNWVDGIAPPEEDGSRYYTLEGETIEQALVGVIGFKPDCFTLTLDDEGKPNILITKYRKDPTETGFTYGILEVFEFCTDDDEDEEQEEN